MIGGKWGNPLVVDSSGCLIELNASHWPLGVHLPFLPYLSSCFCCYVSLYWFLQTFCSKIAIILPGLKDVTTVLLFHHVDGSRPRFSCTQSMFVVVRQAGSEWSFTAWAKALAVTGELSGHLMSFPSFHPEAMAPVHIVTWWCVLGEGWETPLPSFHSQQCQTAASLGWNIRNGPQNTMATFPNDCLGSQPGTEMQISVFS